LDQALGRAEKSQTDLRIASHNARELLLSASIGDVDDVYLRSLFEKFTGNVV